MKQVNELVIISSFFNQFLTQEENSPNLYQQHEATNFKRLFDDIQPLLKEYQEYEILNASNYNIFTILKINTNSPLLVLSEASPTTAASKLFLLLVFIFKSRRGLLARDPG